MEEAAILSFFAALSNYWIDGAVRSLEGATRGLCNFYPIDEDPPGVTPYEVVYATDRLKLRRYAAQEGPRHTPILLVYALIKRPFILDLLSGRSVIENLSRQGFEIYLVDWLPPTRRDSQAGFDTYVNEELSEAAAATRRIAGCDRINMLGYCLGGLLSILWSARNPQWVRNLVTLATPINTEVVENPLFNLVARVGRESVDLITNTYGNCPAWFINTCFTAVAPVHHMVAKYADFHRNRGSRGYTNFFEMFERWMNSDVALAGRFFSELTDYFFHSNPLMRDGFMLAGTRVDLGKIVCPLLNVLGEYDDVVPAESSLPLLNLVGSTDKRNLVIRTGHVGAVVSAGAHKSLWPQVGAWLAERDH
jgi:polyhydroxyalkanoate synthase subunit PhaC